MNAIGFSEKKKAYQGYFIKRWHSFAMPPYTFWLNKSNNLKYTADMHLFNQDPFCFSFDCFSRLDTECNCRKQEQHKISLKEYPEYCGHILKSKAILE